MILNDLIAILNQVLQLLVIESLNRILLGSIVVKNELPSLLHILKVR